MNKSIAIPSLAGAVLCIGITFASCCWRETNSSQAGESCPPTPLSKEQILQEDEGRARQDHQALESKLAATLRATDQLLAASPTLAQGDPALREARRVEEGAAAIITNLDEIVRDRDAAVALGKALFWDMSVGSDGQTACATCHYSAGVDARNEDARTEDAGGVEARISIGVAPRLYDGMTPGVALENSKPLSVSLGVDFLKKEWPSLAGRLAEVAALEAAARARKPEGDGREDEFEAKAHERAATSKNSPTVVNAALFDRLFHDGRARSVFNGYDETGDDGSPDVVGKYRHVGGQLERVLVRLPHAALASQATVPAMSFVEMSWFGRRFYHLGKKLLPMRPLASQTVHSEDSVLSPYRDIESYRDWFEQAFRSEWLSSARIPQPLVREGIDGSEPSIEAVEANFSLLWGVAVMLYEQTLVSDKSPYDLGTLDEKQRQGLVLFRQRGCVDCHLEPEFSAATRSHLYGPLTEMEEADDSFRVAGGNAFVHWLHMGRPAKDERAETMPVPLAEQQLGSAIDRLIVAYDNGFYDVGLGDASRVLGVGADLVGRTVSGGKEDVELDARTKAYVFSPLRMMGATFGGQGDLAPMVEKCLDYSRQEPARDAAELGQWPLPRSIAQRVHPYRPLWIRATVKAPSLRNVHLTAPYGSDGLDRETDRRVRTLLSDLEETIGLYPRPPFPENPNLHPELPIELEEEDVEQLSAFLAALTDERVEKAMAPFDHPSLRVPTVRVVEASGQTGVDTNNWKSIGATGRSGK